MHHYVKKNMFAGFGVLHVGENRKQGDLQEAHQYLTQSAQQWRQKRHWLYRTASKGAAGVHVASENKYLK